MHDALIFFKQPQRRVTRIIQGGLTVAM